MLDLRGGNQPRGVEHEVGGQFFLTHLGQMRRVRTVVNRRRLTGDPLARLSNSRNASCRSCCRAADCVKEPKNSFSASSGPSRSTIACRIRRCTLFRFTPQHGRLICYRRRPFCRCHVWVEPGRMRASETSPGTPRFVAAMPDVFADVIGICER